MTIIEDYIHSKNLLRYLLTYEILLSKKFMHICHYSSLYLLRINVTYLTYSICVFVLDKPSINCFVSNYSNNFFRIKKKRLHGRKVLWRGKNCVTFTLPWKNIESWTIHGKPLTMRIHGKPLTVHAKPAGVKYERLRDKCRSMFRSAIMTDRK